MVVPVSGTAELPHAEESGEGDETGAGDCMEGAEAAVRSLPGFATQRKGTRKGRDGDRKRTERFCLGDCLRRYGRAEDEVDREALNRMHALRADVPETMGDGRRRLCVRAEAPRHRDVSSNHELSRSQEY